MIYHDIEKFPISIFPFPASTFYDWNRKKQKSHTMPSKAMLSKYYILSSWDVLLSILFFMKSDSSRPTKVKIGMVRRAFLKEV
jgi:hypothetical protein